MAKTLIGNIKGKDGRGISKIEKTATTGVVDTYTITYTDGTQSTYEVRNSDDIAIQRQIVPSAAVESSATASQSYSAGDYVVADGVLRRVTASIARGSTISDSNSTATTVTGELASQFKNDYTNIYVGDGYMEFCRTGGIVVMNMYNIVAEVSGSWGTTLVGTVPEGFRPKNQVRQKCNVADADNAMSSGIWVKPSGGIYICNFGGTGLSGSYNFSCTACWPAA